MAFQVSPGVLVQEKDLTNVVPAVATSIGAIAIQSVQGPLDEVVTIGSEKELVEQFFFNLEGKINYVVQWSRDLKN